MENVNTFVTTGGGHFPDVARFLDGAKADQYELKLIANNKKFVITRVWTAAEILRKTEWIYDKNTDLNIYIRPMDDRFILLDDLRRDVLEKLAKIRPCILMETSPENYQAWVKLAEPPPIGRELDTWRELAAEFGADMASAKPNQIGRLPGYYNRKPKYDHAPVVKLHGYADRVSTWQPTLQGSPPPVVTQTTTANQAADTGTDRSGFDFAVACDLVGRGWNDDRIKAHLIKYSYKAQSRKDDYLGTTIRNARKKLGIYV